MLQLSDTRGLERDSCCDLGGKRAHLSHFMGSFLNSHQLRMPAATSGPAGETADATGAGGTGVGWGGGVSISSM